jgi:hypothetical protein
MGRLETLLGTWEVGVVDLSLSGAKVDVAQRPKVRTAVLRWLNFEAIGEVVWRNDHLLGINFDRPLPIETLYATREIAPAVVGLDAVTEAAREWATGKSSA